MEKIKRKYGEGHDYTDHVSITLPSKMIKIMDREAEKRYGTRSGVIREALEKFLLKGNEEV